MMPSQEEIDNQLMRLAIHRRNLAYLLIQEAQHSSVYVPPPIINGINEQRSHIQRIKHILHRWRVLVDDHPDDEQPRFTPAQPARNALPEPSAQVNDAVVPAAIYEHIWHHVTRDFPENPVVQQLKMQQELEAWRTLQTLAADDVPPDIVRGIISNAASTFPATFSTQLYTVNQELAAWRALQTLAAPTMPTDVLAAIIERAAQDFPLIFSTQKHKILLEISHWHELQGE